MAIIYPKQINEKANAAEKKVYQVLKNGLEASYVCYHNYNIQDRQTDFVVIVPGEGLVVVEVKGWDGKSLKVIDNDTIMFYPTSGGEKKYSSPLHQAEGYCYKWRDKINERLKLNIKVVGIVCYPFMTEADYYKCRLDLVSGRDYTILKDDLEDINQFKYVFKQKYKSYNTKGIDEFNQRVYLDIRRMMEPEAEILESLKIPERKQKRMFEKRYYSILAYIPSQIDDELFWQQIDRYYRKWLVGTKIIIILDDEKRRQSIIKYFKEHLQGEIDYLSRYSQFNFFDKEKEKDKNGIFNFEIHLAKLKEAIESFEIVDGNEREQRDLELSNINDCCTSFNYKQYEVEHTLADKNILVKAGAGTGKTYSMVSRIGYLYYIKEYTPERLIEAVIMITFTNEAADNMKVRLKEYFTNMAILTESVEFLRAMENVSRMKISTIHSLSKKVIQAYSKYLGLGRDISIKSGVYERRQLIEAVLNSQMKEKREYARLLTRAKKYELCSAIEQVLDELEKKNISMEEHYIFDEPIEEKELFKLITEVAKKVQNQGIQDNIQHNTVHLSNLMIYLSKLVDAIEQSDDIKQTVDYLFVDEFQDTDDVQIELISRFYKIFGFKLFIVGDTKQSIYRFRGAEDKAFTELKRRGIQGWTKEDLSLNKNYRSDKVLLSKFDDLFSFWGSRDVLEYSNQGTNNDQLTGVNKDIKIKDHIKCMPYKHESSNANETFGGRLIESIEERLQQLDDKYKGTDKKGTIAILVRRNEEIEQIKEICKGKIKVETDFTENLYQLQPTKDLYYLILALQFNTNPKYLYALSQTNYARNISNRVVYQNRTNPQRIIEAFHSDEILPNWSKHLKDIRKKPVLRVVREMIYEIQPWNHYAAQFIEEDQEDAGTHYKINLDLLIEEIVKECGEEYQTINTLEHYLHIKIFANQHQDERSIDSSETAHRVKALTVHKSKGLEYDHVIIPYVHGELTMLGANKMIINDKKVFVRLKLNDRLKLESQGFKAQIKQEKQAILKEEARILYVALTRAKNTVTWLKEEGLKEKGNQKSWKMLLDKEI